MPADFVISQIFAVPRERMFTLWTDVELLKQWFGPAGVTVPQATMVIFGTAAMSNGMAGITTSRLSWL